MVASTKASGLDERFSEKILTDVENNVYVERWDVSSNELGLGQGWRIGKRRLYGGVSDSVDIVTVDNGCLSFVVVPTRGMGIWKGEYGGAFLGWDSPVKNLVHPHHITLEARGGLGWLDGFNEWVVRCGLSSFGAPAIDIVRDNQGREQNVMLTLHGRIANLPANLVKIRVGLRPPHEMGVEGTVCERTMFGSNLKLTTSVVTTPESNTIEVLDTVENLRGIRDEMQLLYHCNYGSPFLEDGGRLVAPFRCVAPRDAAAAKGVDSFNVFGLPTKGFVEQVFFMELLADSKGRTKVMLVNSDETKAASLSFSVKQLPYFTLWKNTASKDEGYVVGLEPGTGFPNPKRFEREKNRVVKLGPAGRYRAEIALSVHLGKDDVQKAIDEIDEIRGGTKPTVAKEPIREFSQV